MNTIGKANRFFAVLLVSFAALVPDARAQAMTTTTVASGTNPSVVGSLVTFTATVTNGTTGRVTFYSGTVEIGAGFLSGGNTVSIVSSALRLGNNSITAKYDGDGLINLALPSTSPAITHVVNPMPAGARPYQLEQVNLQHAGYSTPLVISDLVGSNRFFTANKGTGLELWKTDGSPAGTGLVKDIRPGAAGSGAGGVMAALPSVVLTVANDGTNGSEIWKSDGTAAGTVMVKDICAGACSGAPSVYTMVVAGGNAYFFANDGVSGSELWKSDGTAAGTVMVKDINPGAAPGLPFDAGFVPGTVMGVLNGTVYFFANDGVNGAELWKSDGTAAGTVMVKDITPGAGSTPFYPSPPMLAANGLLYFPTLDNTTRIYTLWRTDGTDAGTIALLTLDDNFEGIGEAVVAKGSVVNAAGRLFFSTFGRPDRLWTSDGTPGGTVAILTDPTCHDIPFSLTELDGMLYFQCADPTNGQELWKSDGTPGGTLLAQDIAPGADDSLPHSIGAAGGSLYFFAQDPNFSFLWKSDGSPTGATKVNPLWMNTGLLLGPNFHGYFKATPNGVVFPAQVVGDSGVQLWRTDGTEAGTYMLPAISFGTTTTDAGAAALLGSNLVFVADDAVFNTELWHTGSAAGSTILLKDIAPDPMLSTIALLTPVQGTVVNPSGLVMFRANDGVNGTELWKTDGTPAGTQLVKNIRAGSASSQPSALVNVNGTLFFAANDGTNGIELWKSDGTNAGTVLVKDATAGSATSNVVFLTNVGGTAFYNYRNATSGNQLWKSDGTDPGTVLVKDIAPGVATSAMGNFRPIGNTLYFTANDQVNGTELWKSDGTTAGTVMVKDIRAGGSSSPTNLVNVAGTLFFSSNDGVNGNELWKSDGTSAGTVMVKDVTPGAGSTSFGIFRVAGNRLVFLTRGGSTSSDLASTKLWTSDGTDAGTVVLKDLCAGTPVCSGFFDFLFEFDNAVYFALTDDAGQSLWRTNGTVAGTVKIFTGDMGTIALGTIPTGIYVFRNAGVGTLEPWFFAFDLTPDAFTFAPATAAPAGVATSAAATPTGYDRRVAVTIDVGEFSIGCTGTFATTGMIGPGETICVRNTASSTVGGQVVSTVTIGGVTGTFTSTAEPPPAARLVNISTRMQVGTGNDVLIGGFVIGGSGQKTVAIVATGPSLAAFGITNPLANPTLRLVRSSDQAVLGTNDDWQAAANSAQLTAAGLAPSNALEAAILIDLAPGAYTAIVEGVGGGTGVSVIGVYEVGSNDQPLVNISTRGRVLTGDDVMIGGFVIQGSVPRTIGIVATGPSLAPFGIANPLANPMLTIVRSSDQAVVATNDDWQQDSNAAALQAAGLAPTNALEAALLLTLPPGAYTAIVQGVGGGTGVSVIGVYAAN